MNVAVVMGGYSDESVISLRSGQLILNHLDKSKYTVYEVHILAEGWFCITGQQKYPIDRSDFSFETENQKINFDVAVNTVHGTPGEDGHLQAYWELAGIAYTGCSFYHSALTFNKRDTLSVLSKFNIPKANSIYITKGDNIDGPKIAAELGFPFFVKPNQSGSSLGVSKVDVLDQLDKALDFAFAEDNDILIESYLNGTEVSVGVIKYKGETKGGSVFAGAVGWTPGSARFQVSGGVGYQTRNGFQLAGGVRRARGDAVRRRASTFGFGAFAGVGGGPAGTKTTIVTIPVGHHPSRIPSPARRRSRSGRPSAGGTRSARLTDLGLRDAVVCILSGGSKTKGLFRAAIGADRRHHASRSAPRSASISAQSRQGARRPELVRSTALGSRTPSAAGRWLVTCPCGRMRRAARRALRLRSALGRAHEKRHAATDPGGRR